MAGPSPRSLFVPNLLAALLLALSAVTGMAQDAQPPLPPLPSWSSDTQKAWWEQNPLPAQWPKAVANLTAQLQASYKQNGASSFSNSDFQGWLEHLEWIRLGLDCPGDLTDANNLNAFVQLGKDETVSHLLVEKLDPLDVKNEALLNLIRLAQANLDDLHEYAALGIAFSLVFDRPFPLDWPHRQVKQEAVPIGDLDVVKRFNFYVQANRNQKTDEDLTQLSFEKLKFVVDSEVNLSELEYAQHNRISNSSFADAFFSINYDVSRSNSGNFDFVWGLPTYTLQDIEKHGGICVDQAYYAFLLGKGRGIPTLYFHGQGTDGGHAWFGYMSRSGKWELDCGRYASQNYPKGYALDPQTWQVIDDARLTQDFKNGEQNPNYQPARNAIAWARLQAHDPSCKKILDDARSIMPELAQTWEMEASFLEYIHASDDDKKTFYQDWVSQFSAYPEMKIEGQRCLLAVLKKNQDPAADSLEQDIILANRSSSIDAGMQGEFDSIFEKIKAGDWDAARLGCERAIRDFGEQGGGTLFYGIIRPYVETCLKNGHVDQAQQATGFARDRMPVRSDSVLGEEFLELEGKVFDAKQKGSASPSP